LMIFLLCLDALLSFFFFQAEDGIRAFHVTGVQTCALPISALRQGNMRERLALGVEHHDSIELFGLAFEFVDFPAAQLGRFFLERSEERRVGKERMVWTGSKHSLNENNGPNMQGGTL